MNAARNPGTSRNDRVSHRRPAPDARIPGTGNPHIWQRAALPCAASSNDESVHGSHPDFPHHDVEVTA
jgi:hypothetical protein